MNTTEHIQKRGVTPPLSCEMGTVEDLFHYPDTAFNLSLKLSQDDVKIEIKEENTISIPELTKLFIGKTPQGVNHIIKDIYNLSPIKRGRANYLSSPDARTLLTNCGFKFPESAKVIAIQTTKGGVGKSTLAINMAKRLNQYGAKVLLIDTDQQANATLAYNIDGEDQYSLYDVISEEQDCLDITINDAILKITPSLHILPSNTDNSLLESYMTMRVTRLDLLFDRLLTKVKDQYDYIIIDCSPTLGSLNSGILLSVDELIIPQIPDNFSWSSIGKTLKWMRDVTRSYEGKRSTKIKIFLNRYDHSRSSVDFLGKSNSTPLVKNFTLDTVVRNCEEIRKQLNKNQSIFDTLKSTTIREDMDSLIKEIITLTTLTSNTRQQGH